MTIKGFRTAGVAGLLLIGAVPAAGQDDAAAKQQLVNNPDPASFQIYGAATPPKVVKDKSVQAERAVLVTVSGMGKPSAVGATVPTTKPVKAGDKLSVMFFARLHQAEPGVTAGKLPLRLQLNQAPYTSFAEKTVELTDQWKIFNLDAVADKDYPAGKMSVAFQLNTAKQVTALGIVAVYDKGK